jgi:hypothetical protein
MLKKEDMNFKYCYQTFYILGGFGTGACNEDFLSVFSEFKAHNRYKDQAVELQNAEKEALPTLECIEKLTLLLEDEYVTKRTLRPKALEERISDILIPLLRYCEAENKKLAKGDKAKVAEFEKIYRERRLAVSERHRRGN